MSLTVTEITMATPDVICVEIHDGPIRKGVLTNMGSTQSGDFVTWNNYADPAQGGINELGRVFGPNKDYVKFQDKNPLTFLGRVGAVDFASYGTIGGRTVTAASLKSKPYQEGKGAGNQSAGAQAGYAITSFQHFIYLSLSANLPQGGPYTITFPASSNIVAASFAFEDHVTRSHAIRTSFIGHRPGDVTKIAYLAVWIPGRVNEGQTDFINTYGLNTFELINDRGSVLFTGSIVQRVTPSTSEPTVTSGGITRYASTENPPVHVTGIAAGTPGVVTAPSHGLSNGDFIYFRGTDKVSNITLYSVGGAATDTFNLLDSLGANVTIGGTFTAGTAVAGYTDQLFKTYTANRAGTYVFGLDYSAYTTSINDLVRIRVPGLGVSDPFHIHDAVYHEACKTFAKGPYNQRSGIALDGRFGLTRPAPMRHGQNGFTIFKSIVPSAFAVQQFVVTTGAISSNGGGYGTNLTASTIDAGGEWMDAGDWDVFTWGHAVCTAQVLLAADFAIQAGSLTSFNIPQSSAVLDPTNIYPTSLPDLLNEALWGLGCYLRTQDPITGEVPSGLEGSAPDNLFSQNGEGTNDGSPSFLTRSQWYAFKGDELGNFAYAGNAAIASRLLRTLGHITLADTYLDSAILAFDFAEGLYSDSPAGTRDAWYKSPLTTQVVFTANVTSGNFTITSVSSTAGLVVGMELVGRFNFSGTLASGNPQITLIDDLRGVEVGKTITSTGTGIPASSTVLSIDDTTVGAGKITISNNATATGSRDLTCSRTTGLPIDATVNKSNAYITSIDSATQITFINVAPKGSTIPATSTVSGVTLIARNPDAGWSNALYTSNYNLVHATALQDRVFAAGALFRANGGGAAYKSIVDTNVTLTNQQGLDAYGNFEYSQATGATALTIAIFKAGVQGGANSGITNWSSAANVAYKTIVSSASVTQYPLAQWYIFADILNTQGGTPQTKYRGALQAAMGVAHGANQMGISPTNTMGPRSQQAYLHNDAQAMTIDGPPGITAYSFSYVNVGRFPTSFFIFFANSNVSYANDTSSTLADLAANFVPQRIVEPYRVANPGWDNYWTSQGEIAESEFTVQQTVHVQLLIAMYLHAWDGNQSIVIPSGASSAGKGRGLAKKGRRRYQRIEDELSPAQLEHEYRLLQQNIRQAQEAKNAKAREAALLEAAKQIETLADESETVEEIIEASQPQAEPLDWDRVRTDLALAERITQQIANLIADMEEREEDDVETLLLH